MKITATPNVGETLSFDWDPDAGTLSGDDAGEVLALVDHAGDELTLYGTQPASAPDPLHSRRDMAVLLTAFGYQVPAELGELLPEPETIPDGAVA